VPKRARRLAVTNVVMGARSVLVFESNRQLCRRPVVLDVGAPSSLAPPVVFNAANPCSL
jgi:hypothetical protein